MVVFKKSDFNVIGNFDVFDFSCGCLKSNKTTTTTTTNILTMTVRTTTIAKATTRTTTEAEDL